MPCGIGDYTSALAAAFAEQNISVGLFTSTTANPAKDCGFKLFPIVEHWDRSALPALEQTMRTWSPDIVHFQYPTQGYGIGWAPSFIPRTAARAGAKVVRTWHELPVPRGVPRFFLQSLGGGPIIVVRPNFYLDMAAPLRLALSRDRFTFIASASPIPRSGLNAQQRADKNAELRGGAKRLIVYFGFIYPHKGVDQLFSICDPAIDRLVISGKLDDGDEYHARIRSLAVSPEWNHKVKLTGFLPDKEIADLLAVADAVILPFAGGGGEWNTSLLSAQKQGTFVITTSATRRGYHAGENTFYAAPGDISAMREALQLHSGKKIDRSVEDEWDWIAREHIAVYERVLAGRQ